MNNEQHARPVGPEPTAKKAKKAVPELPTRDEQKQLQQMEILMRSNLLTLQTSELLNEVSAAGKFSSKRLGEWMEHMKSDLASSAKHTCANREVSVSWVKGSLAHYALSFSEYDPADNIAITYQPPSAVEVVGSFASSAATAPLYNIDVCVTMPASIFSSRDLLNYVYFDKRKLFLAGLRKSLEQINKKLGDAAPRYKNFCTVLFKGDERKPLLQFQPAHSDSIVVRIIPSIPEGVFKAVQLRDEKNNVRPLHWMQRLKELKKSGQSSAELDKETVSLPPTAEYNRAVLEDLTISLHAQILSRTLSPFSSVCEALVLFKVWLTQRELRLTPTGFDAHMAAMLLGYLVQSGRLSPQAAPLSLFQSVLAFLCASDLATQALEFSPNTTSSYVLRKKTEAGFPSDIVVLSHPLPGQATMCCNVLWRLSESSLRALQSEAARSLAALQAQEQGVFHALFLSKRGFFERNDAFLTLALPKNGWSDVLRQASEGGENEEEDIEGLREVSLSRSLPLYAAQSVHALLSKALGDRVSSLCVSLSPPHAQRVGESVTDASRPLCVHGESEEDESENVWRVYVGVVFDNEKSTRKVDRGPALPAAGSIAQKKAAQQELDAFRSFYGEKIQLRRFRDGSIVESVVWDCAEANKRVSLFENIAFFVLGRHLPWIISGQNSGQKSMSSVMNIPTLLPLSRTWNVLSKGKSVLSFTSQAVEALDELRHVCVNTLSHTLPVKIDTLAALCAELRYTSLLPPQPHLYLQHRLEKESDDSESLRDSLRAYMGESLSLVVRPLRVCVRFASSSHWPTDAEALEKCKNAFLLKMRSELAKIEIYSVIHDGSLDVIFKGYAFRLVPFAGVDVEKNAFKGERDDGESALTIAHREWTIPPLHHNAIRHVQHTHTCFGECVQLVMLWLARHHLSQHVSQRCVELLCAHEFVSSVAQGAPTTATAAFVRVLQRLTTHDWEEDPLIVDLSQSAETNTQTDSHSLTRALSTEERNTIAMRMRVLRNTAKAEKERGNELPHYLNPSMYIVSSCDAAIDFNTAFTHNGDVPERVVLHMIVNFAKHTLKHLRQWVFDPENAFLDATARLCKDSTDKNALVSVTDAFVQSVLVSEAVLRHCDVVLHFHKALVSTDADEGPQCARLQVFANMNNKQLLLKNLVVLDEESSIHPMQAQIVQKLRAAFSDEALFFWDETQGRRLGVLFKPKFKVETEFSVLKTKFRALSDDGKALLPNVEELLEQIMQESDGLLCREK